MNFSFLIVCQQLHDDNAEYDVTLDSGNELCTNNIPSSNLLSNDSEFQNMFTLDATNEENDDFINFSFDKETLPNAGEQFFFF